MKKWNLASAMIESEGESIHKRLETSMTLHTYSTNRASELYYRALSGYRKVLTGASHPISIECDQFHFSDRRNKGGHNVTISNKTSVQQSHTGFSL